MTEKNHSQNPLDVLPEGQRRVVVTLISQEQAPTYPQVARLLGISEGTVYRHLKRVRDNHPELHALIMELRRQQLDKRHEAALLRAAQHSHEWGRKILNRLYYHKHGYWPWQRHLYDD